MSVFSVGFHFTARQMQILKKKSSFKLISQSLKIKWKQYQKNQNYFCLLGIHSLNDCGFEVCIIIIIEVVTV